jgi:hypothetical protein
MTTTPAPQEEKRNTARHRVFKRAQISFRGLHAAIDCVVRDFSDGGARLTVETSVGVPDRFELVRDGLPTKKCQVVWRHATQIGVQFIPEIDAEAAEENLPGKLRAKFGSKISSPPE